MSLRCTRVLITGASRGIGLAIAHRLVGMGAQVTLAGRSRETLEKAARAFPAGRAHPMVLDVRDTASLDTAITQAAGYMGGLDGLVNNAGVVAYTREWGWALFEQTDADWNMVVDTNMKAPFFLSRAAARHMLDHGVQGNILNVLSEAAYAPASASYGASKAGALALTRGLGRLLAPRGIIVNAIAPGTTETDMVDLPRERDMKRQPNGRLGTPEEMAALAAFLMSTEGENIIGQAVLSCGGSLV